jgi:hypothetical protein
VSPFKVTDVFTDSSALSDEERENVSTGLIDIHKKSGETSYKVDINMDTYALMKLLDAANVLSYTNYYAESIAGSLVTGSADDARTNAFNGAGSFALVRTNNTVNAALGSNVTIKKKGDGGEGVNITADDATNARMIGGAASGVCGENVLAQGLALDDVLGATDVRLERLAERLAYLWLVIAGRSEF